ncbi:MULTISPECIES: N(4)-(beta-N-acetylglucosaminyl)-L-asparaginase [Terrabacteria group]|uniref:N(4)-(beta-N-acetylglucosaminyl)-L-asparaginase n=1 Tax=Bacillati TaxID=1783272 RepID=UPI001C6EA841|nr:MULTISPECIES: N(4)-(beta-N-acetylglucosaminyl)-L-asparaginase [Terrabacteria group]MBW9212885.1 N(4)-(beta-N-acetylglucosaminyl)-L-asparaginase [Trueperella sp. zg.1013]
MWAMIATWRMALEGVCEAGELLKKGKEAGEVVEQAIRMVEDFPYYKSVGYGGLPNEEMIVELDAGYMDGNTLSVGAVAGIKDFANPVSIAKELSKDNVNCVLVAEGAEKYASQKGFERKTMLTERAKKHYHKRVKKLQSQELKPYDGHDTVGEVVLDQAGKVVVATSTSGLFMKKAGRIGDSPIVGAGFYADSEVGGASATGLGEDLMKGCISYEIVRKMKEGLSPQEACQKAVNELDEKLKKSKGFSGDLSVIAIDKNGQFGCATNIQQFSFVVYRQNEEAVVYLADNVDGETKIYPASQEWMDQYMQERMAPITE